MSGQVFFIDPSRCINCKTCEAVCASRDDHHGITMIHFTTTYPGGTANSFAQVCMHCEDPLCVRVCEPGAIGIADDGTVLGVIRECCTGCKLCVQACPFEVPLYVESVKTAMKCDMCFDRNQSGEKPKCAAACPTGALAFTSEADMGRARRGTAVHDWVYGDGLHTKAGFISRQDDPLFDNAPFDIADALQGLDGYAYYGRAEGTL